MEIVTKLVNDQVAEIKNLVPKTSTEQAAMLEAINAVSDQLKKQTEVLSLQKEVEELKKQVTELEEVKTKLARLEEQERLARESLKKDGADDSVVTNHVEAQQILNEQTKKKIRETNSGPREVTPFEAKQGKLDL
jgi:cell division protein ZapA